ncbi:MAG: serine/threonine protein phosphatase, partial [Rhodoblastus sp.]|nr:serine/threonine protein phosphatase [Rhodoblastus sp.]
MFQMVFSQLSRLVGHAPRPAPKVPPRLRIYAIGDIHGRFDLLQALTVQIAEDLAEGHPEHVLTIFLGDYVDRGPQSASVIAELSAGRFPTPIVALRGNHEEMFLQFLSTPDILDSWRRYGGLETLHSYGVDVADAMRGSGYAKAQGALVAKLPSAHADFLQSTQTHDSWGDYYFCHAGVKPHVPLEAQTGDDLYWI